MFSWKYRKIIAIWTLAAVGLIVNTVVSSYNVNVLIQNDDRLRHSYHVLSELTDILNMMIDRETTMRGYVLTGDEDYLSPGEDYAKELRSELARLKELVSDNPTQSTRFSHLAAVAVKRYEYGEKTIAVRREESLAAAQRRIATGDGKRTMDDARQAIDAMRGEEEMLLADRAEVSRSKYRATTMTNLLGGALTLLITILAYFLTQREIARREAATLVASEAKLETAVAIEMAANEVRASEDRFRTLAEVVPQMVWITRPDGFVEYFNSRWYEYTGLTPDQSLGSGWSGPLHPDDRACSEARWLQATSTGEPYEIEHRFRAADGSYRWFLGQARPTRDRDGTISRWFGTCTDIDDQRREKDQLDQLVTERTGELHQKNLELSRSNEELDKFAYVASHDLQEPLRKIQAFGDRLQTKCRDQLSDQGKDYLDRVLNSAGRMRRLIDDLLVFARVTSKGKTPELTDLNAIMTDVLYDLEITIAKAEATVEVGPLPTLAVDRTQFRQLFQNLIGNAIKFRKPDHASVVNVRADAIGERWHLIISDNGIGFEPQFQERVFELFQRLHGRDQYEGTGIGLAICKKIVERHGGTITASSTPDHGATFTIDLPTTVSEGTNENGRP